MQGFKLKAEALHSDIPEILSEFAKGMDNTTHPTIWQLNENSSVIEKFDKGIQSIIIGEKTPKQVAAEVQAIKERELKKADKNSLICRSELSGKTMKVAQEMQSRK